MVSSADSVSTAPRQNNGGAILDAPRPDQEARRLWRTFEDGSAVVIVVGDTGSTGYEGAPRHQRDRT